jgi:hypothetical protein
VSDSELEREVRQALAEVYQPAPWLLSRARAAVRGDRGMRRPWAVVAGFAAAVIAVSAIGVVWLGGVHGKVRLPAPANTGFPETPAPLTGQLPLITDTPPYRADPAIAYDPLTRQTIMFGGLPGGKADTWAWDGQAWKPLDQAAHPHGRFGASMAFDPVLQGIVMIGGNPNSSTDADVDADMRATWLWQGGSWRRIPTAHTPVPPNYAFFWGASMAYDGKTGELVLVAVQGMTHFRQCSADTWTFNGSDWVHRSLAQPLPASIRLTVSDGPNGHVLVLLNPRQEVAPVGFVTTSCPAGSPEARALPGPSTWEWTGSAWTELGGSQPPDITGTDGDVGATLLGDHAAVVTEDGTVWTWTGSGWSAKSTAKLLPARAQAGVSEDRNGRLLVFGGILVQPELYLDSTWLWDGATWKQVPSRPNASAPATASR